MGKNKKGFTLIELLAVIVILGLLMAIAIPSVTKYITQSRVKTLISTVDSYVRSVSNQVNDGDYKFSDSTKIFAIPIECVSLEKGGSDPFGNWMQANEAYWAYVLVHYDNNNYNYEYGFTFKDDAGYGLYPTKIDKINSSMVKTGYDDLKQPKDGLALNFVSSDKWEGFTGISISTELIVLEADSEGSIGDGQDTCTLCQKGSNYEEIEKEKETRPFLLLKDIKKKNPILNDKPTLTTTFTKSSDISGLYSSNKTNTLNATYYFRGNVENNYVQFANQLWRIVRINEDNSIRLITQKGINNNISYEFNNTYSDWNNTYYSNSNAKSVLNIWYSTNLQQYQEFIVASKYCEAARVKYGGYTAGEASMSVYNQYSPTFECYYDGNNKGPITEMVGMLSYDEYIYAGGYPDNSNNNFYLTNGNSYWTMSPIGTYAGITREWDVLASGYITDHRIDSKKSIRAVISLNSDVMATGKGTALDPYIIQVN